MHSGAHLYIRCLFPPPFLEFLTSTNERHKQGSERITKGISFSSPSKEFPPIN